MRAHITKEGIVLEYDSQEEPMVVDYFIKNTMAIEREKGGHLITNDVPIIFTRFENRDKDDFCNQRDPQCGTHCNKPSYNIFTCRGVKGRCPRDMACYT